jgi:hypothetical protein
MFNLQQLKEFLLASNKAGYAGGEEKKWVKEPDGSTTIPFQSGAWRSNDNFFGGEPYGGRVVVFFENKPIWIMVYYGWVVEGEDTNEVYAILRKALMQMPDNYPYRGPEKLVEGEFVYQNSWSGELDKYTGEEFIAKNGKEIYRATYMGGLVDTRGGV